jgi:TolB-like protein/Flp pilus assembly protein TadD
MSEPPKAVFLSYASQDAEAARRICAALRAAGVEVWFDQAGGLEHGDEWDAKIRRQIKECVFFLPVVSAHTQARAEGYFRIEWELAAERAMGFAHHVPFILPIVVDDTSEANAFVPERFRKVQWTRLPGGHVAPDIQARFLKLWSERTGRHQTMEPGRPRPGERGGGAASPTDFAPTGQETRATTPPAADDKSIAVLPFANMSADAENEYFSDGMTEEIINALVQVPDLRVAARTSVFAFKGKADDLRTIAAKLNVRTVLEGSVRKAGNKIRITAQLINAADGFHLWSEKFDRGLDDIFAVQDEIARAIVDKLKAKLAGGAQQPLVKPPTEDIEAYQLYLQGRYFWNQRGAGLTKGLRCFEAALALDPDYALAHAGVADAYTLLGFYGHSRPNEVMPKARAAAERALALDPTLAEAHCALGFIFQTYDRNVVESLRELRRAIELKPTYVTSYYWLASAKLAMLRVDESIACDAEAVRIEPYSLMANTHLGWMFLCADRPADAVPPLTHVIELEPKALLAHWLLGQACILLDRSEEGLAELRLAAEISGNLPWMVGGVASALAYLGRKAEAREVLATLMQRHETEYVKAFSVAVIHAYLGDHREMMHWLERATEENDSLLVYLDVGPGKFIANGIPFHIWSGPTRAAFFERLGIVRE